MKHFKKLVAGILTLIALFIIMPTSAHAEWRQNTNGWWYSQGSSSYATGWSQIGGQWYYFDSNGYMKTGWINDNGTWYYTYSNGSMAHDCYIGNYYLNSSGAWVSNMSTTNTNTSSTSVDNNNSSKDNQSQTQTNTNNKHILVAYFSRSGNTKVIANQIHEKAGGDIFEIKTVDPYPNDYAAAEDKASKELSENFRPKLAEHVSNINSYDVIFVGYPIWWGNAPMSIFSFLEENNLSGKTIIPFSTHQGSGLGSSVQSIKKSCPQSTILDGLAIRDSNINNANNDISEWLNKLNITK